MFHFSHSKCFSVTIFMGEVSGNPIQVPVLAVLSSEMPREIRHPFITVSYERSSKRWTGMICYSLKSSAQPLLGNGIKPFMKDIALLGITKSDLICRNSHWYLPSQSGSLALCIRKFCRIGSRKLSGIFWKKKKKRCVTFLWKNWRDTAWVKGNGLLYT